MKRIITKFTIVALVVLFGNSSRTMAQVTPGVAPTPATPGAQFVCQEGAVLDLGSPPGTGNEWLVKFSPTSDISTPTAITNLTGNKISGNDVKTGYYVITTKSTEGGCESDNQIIPVYILPTLVPTFSSADYCTVNAAATDFTATVTPAAPSGAEIAYQWYTVSESAETKVDGATSAAFHPTITNATDAAVTVTYRLKAAYKINDLIYCPISVDKTVKVLPKPVTPTITIGQTGQSAIN